MKYKLNPCKRCGSTCIELIGTNDGDTPFVLCHDCSFVFSLDDERGIPIPDVERLISAWNSKNDKKEEIK